MTESYQKEGKGDEARDFLAQFLVQLQGLRQTHQDLLKVQLQTIQQQQQIIAQNQQVLGEMRGLNARLDGLAQRCDYLYNQMGELGNILIEDGGAHAEEMPSIPPALGQAFQGVVQNAMDGLVFGPNGRRGNSGRRRGR